MNTEVLETLEGKLSFVMNFGTIRKLDERYGHQKAIDIFDSIRDFNSPKFSDSVLKVLECCCINRELNEGELEKLLLPSFENIVKIDTIAFKLVLGFLGEPEEEGEENKKQIETSQKELG